MNTSILNQDSCYGLYDGEEIIGFAGPILHHPTRNNPKMKRAQRLVILPDYQGIGLGTKFLNFIAEMYTNKGWTYCAITSSRNLVNALKRDDNWIAYNKKGFGVGHQSKKMGYRKTREVATVSFLYKPNCEKKDGEVNGKAKNKN